MGIPTGDTIKKKQFNLSLSLNEEDKFTLRVTIFGESAGSASIGHLLLSDVTTGLFAQGIGQSGSALASWAFDAHPEQHALEIASKVGCIIFGFR